jgi:hypothetical protein
MPLTPRMSELVATWTKPHDIEPILLIVALVMMTLWLTWDVTCRTFGRSNQQPVTNRVTHFKFRAMLWESVVTILLFKHALAILSVIISSVKAAIFSIIPIRAHPKFLNAIPILNIPLFRARNCDGFILNVPSVSVFLLFFLRVGHAVVVEYIRYGTQA